MRVWIGLIVLGAAACGDNGSGDDDGAAPDAGAVLHPGPCTATGTRYECTYTYDDRGLPASATCFEDNPVEPGTIGATWTYDGDALVGFRRTSQYETSTMRDIVWDLDATPPTRHETGHDGGVFTWVRDEDFEAEGLVLVGQLFDLRLSPSADDRTTRWHSVTDNLDDGSQSVVDTTYTYDPATVPTDGTRVRTSSDGDMVELRYEGGHLVVGPSASYTWSGDRLTRLVHSNAELAEIEYLYDDAGNLTERRAGEVVTTYDYACWD